MVPVWLRTIALPVVLGAPACGGERRSGPGPDRAAPAAPLAYVVAPSAGSDGATGAGPTRPATGAIADPDAKPGSGEDRQRPTPTLARPALGRAIDRALAGPPKSGGGLPVVPESGRPAQTPRSTPRAPRPPDLDRDYVRARMLDSIVPAAQACYADRSRARPGLVARVDVMFTLAGLAGLGGVVESVTVTGASVEGPELTDCIRESALGLTLVAPPSDGRSRIGYTFGFNPPDSPEAG